MIVAYLYCLVIGATVGVAITNDRAKGPPLGYAPPTGALWGIGTPIVGTSPYTRLFYPFGVFVIKEIKTHPNGAKAL